MMGKLKFSQMDFFLGIRCGKHYIMTELETDTALIDRVIKEHKLDRVKGIFVTHLITIILSMLPTP